MYPDKDDAVLALDIIEKYTLKINKLFNSVEESDRKILIKGLTDNGSSLKARFSFMYQVLAEVVTQETTTTFDKKEWRKLISLFKETVDMSLQMIEEEE